MVDFGMENTAICNEICVESLLLYLMGIRAVTCTLQIFQSAMWKPIR